ncbi:hypothetical protein [Clostridium sp.]|uniref:hypothetical protein n=1 Tax=Clostridium sp. TaxID=1506 RepID=UPI002FC5F303
MIIINKIRDSKYINKNKNRAKEYIKINNKYKEYINNNYEKLKSKICLNIQVYTLEEAIKELEKIDIRKLLNIKTILGEEFETDLDVDTGIVAFIVKSEDDFEEKILKLKWENEIEDYTLNRYFRFGKEVAELKFLRKNKKAKIILNNRDKTYKMEFLDGEYSYGIVDLYEIIMKVDYYTALRELISLTRIFVKDIDDITDNYLFNYSRICFWDKYKVHYPSMNKFIERHLNKLKILLDEGINGLYKNYKDASIFSVSLEFLANNIGISKKTLSPIINIFTAIGLIEKVDDIKEKRTSYNNITYYRIPRWTENVLNEADYLCSKFLELNVSPTKVTAKHIAMVLGKDTTLKIVRDNKAIKLLSD